MGFGRVTPGGRTINQPGVLASLATAPHGSPRHPQAEGGSSGSLVLTTRAWPWRWPSLLPPSPLPLVVSSSATEPAVYTRCRLYCMHTQVGSLALLAFQGHMGRGTLTGVLTVPGPHHHQEAWGRVLTSEPFRGWKTSQGQGRLRTSRAAQSLASWSQLVPRPGRGTWQVRPLCSRTHMVSPQKSSVCTCVSICVLCSCVYVSSCVMCLGP